MTRFAKLEFECLDDADPDFHKEIRMHEALARHFKDMPGVLVYRRKYLMTPSINFRTGHSYNIYSIWAILLDPKKEKMVIDYAESLGLHEDEDAFEWVDESWINYVRWGALSGQIIGRI